MADKLKARGKNDIFEYVSQNEKKAIYLETKGEGLMTMLRKFIHAKELDEADPKPKGKESRYRTLLTEHQAFSHHLSRLSNIWSCKHTIKILLDLYMCRPHMLDSKLTKVS